MPDDRYAHTQSGLVACGGYGSYTSCLSFSSGEWRTSHELYYSRYEHSSWMSQQGLVLMGGVGHENTAELVTVESDVGNFVVPFILKYETR